MRKPLTPICDLGDVDFIPPGVSSEDDVEPTSALCVASRARAACPDRDVLEAVSVDVADPVDGFPEVAALISRDDVERANSSGLEVCELGVSGELRLPEDHDRSPCPPMPASLKLQAVITKSSKPSPSASPREQQRGGRTAKAR
jgi:hypothetical protein